ncbi:MAG: hypothetical protein Devi2KO_39880 [Devosia indica]
MVKKEEKFIMNSCTPKLPVCVIFTKKKKNVEKGTREKKSEEVHQKKSEREVL